MADKKTKIEEEEPDGVDFDFGEMPDMDVPDFSFGDEAEEEKAEADPDEETYDPLANVPVTGSMEKDSIVEVQTLADAFADNPLKKRFRESRREHEIRTDSRYWTCVCFESREQLEQFLKLTKMDADGSLQYIDGRKLAANIGIQLESENPKFIPAKVDPTWEKLAR